MGQIWKTIPYHAGPPTARRVLIGRHVWDGQNTRLSQCRKRDLEIFHEQRQASRSKLFEWTLSKVYQNRRRVPTRRFFVPAFPRKYWISHGTRYFHVGPRGVSPRGRVGAERPQLRDEKNCPHTMPAECVVDSRSSMMMVLLGWHRCLWRCRRAVPIYQTRWCTVLNV